ncbi:MAG TPA: YfhO family protein [Candidatus Alistipes avicola]|uniref:YfhO family protein n=1 Tax=Candidatus Alistipes avicola TaxID=2838432 RepID=A0A9D2L4C9_9BACT|nr:YfhO family protein [Candidatus Alistipes avicola]
MSRFKEILPRWLPYCAALLLFFIVSALYFAPQFQGEELPQHDVQQYQGMSKEIWDNRAQTGEDPQWAGRMFGGMPAYLINVAYPAQLVKNTVGQVVRLLDTPAAFVFFAMVSMWLMLLIVGVNPWVGIVPALMYGLSTYFFLIIGAGHITKMWALVYAPLMMGGAWLTLRGNMWIGGALTALFASLEIGANHPQITYYFLLAMAALWVSEGIQAFRKKYLPSFAKRTAVLIAAGILAVGSNFSPLWYTLQHSKQTMRGGSELTESEESSDNGLALEYATAWSYGRAESWNMLIPDFMGGDSGRTFERDGEVARALRPYGLSDLAQQLPAYWGEQPYTAGPTYLGAAAIFLAVLGLLLASGRNKWWIVAVSLLALLLAWGHNFMGFTEFMFKYLPGYNKFRTVSMILVVIEWTVPLLAALALMPLWRGEIPRQKLLKALAWAGGVTGGICLLFALVGGTLFGFGRTESNELMSWQYYQMFQAAGMEDAIAQGVPEELGEVTADAMAVDRAAIMRADAWRSLLMIALAAGSVLLFALGRLKRGGLVAALTVIVLIDLIPVNLRYLPQSRFVTGRQNKIVQTEADRAILRDPELGFRVLNLTVSPFNDATTSYFHRSVGGYHGAKLARYQDLIERYLSSMDEGVLDMLNTRYVIQYDQTNGQPTAYLRQTANGAAWFVDGIVDVSTPHEEIDALGYTDLKTTAVINTDEFGNTLPTAGGKGEIRLTEYRPNYLKYQYTAGAPALAVFSEIYFNDGWEAFIDGKEAHYLRADYVLRAMELPAGTHTVEWRFRAPHWTLIEGITLVSSLAILGGLLVTVILVLRHERRQKTQA